MKKLISFILCLLICALPVITVNAESTVSFELTNVECSNNRLFSVDVIAKSDKPLCAAYFEFTYDKSFAEFRSVKTNDKDALVRANEKSGCVAVSYLSADGKELSTADAIFTLNFKSVSPGELIIGFTVSDCVDSDVEFMSIGSCASGKVKISGKAGLADDSQSADVDRSKSSDYKDVETSSKTADELTDLGLVNEAQTHGNDNRFVLAVIVIGLVLIIASAVGFALGRRLPKRESKPDNKEGGSNEF